MKFKLFVKLKIKLVTSVFSCIIAIFEKNLCSVV